MNSISEVIGTVLIAAVITAGLIGGFFIVAEVMNERGENVKQEHIACMQAADSDMALAMCRGTLR